jgi:hypothetical protein
VAGTTSDLKVVRSQYWSEICGSVDLGPDKGRSYFLAPVRISLRPGREAEDLDAIILALRAVPLPKRKARRELNDF